MQMTLTGGVSGAEIIAVLFGGGTPDITAVQVPLIRCFSLYELSHPLAKKRQCDQNRHWPLHPNWSNTVVACAGTAESPQPKFEASLLNHCPLLSRAGPLLRRNAAALQIRHVHHRLCRHGARPIPAGRSAYATVGADRTLHQGRRGRLDACRGRSGRAAEAANAPGAVGVSQGPTSGCAWFVPGRTQEGPVPCRLFKSRGPLDATRLGVVCSVLCHRIPRNCQQSSTVTLS